MLFIFSFLFVLPSFSQTEFIKVLNINQTECSITAGDIVAIKCKEQTELFDFQILNTNVSLPANQSNAT